MCDVAPETVSFQPNLGKNAWVADGLVKRIPTIAEFGVYSYDERKAKESGVAEYSKQGLDVIANDLITNGHNYISMFEPPEITRSFGENLSMDQEIKELLSTDIYFNYILFNILKILNNVLDEYRHPYRVEVLLETDEDNPNWTHADISVKLNDESIGSEIWKKSSKKAKEFYKSIEMTKLIPSETIKRIHKFIYIIVD
jgi:hypothetical protein